MEHNLDTIMERATYYYKHDIYDLRAVLQKIISPYNSIWSTVRDDSGSDAVYSNMHALTKPDYILLILQLTEPKYEAIKTLPQDQLPLLINEDLEYPDIIALYKSRLKNG